MYYLFLLIAFGWAQTKVCGTDLYMQEEERHHPFLPQLRAQLDQAIAEWIQAHSSSLQRGAEEECIESEFVIPVVVHIIHSGNGQPDSIPLSRVFRQMDQLFDDYRRRPYSKGYSSGVDTRIELSLATKDPQGNPHIGVTYTRFTEAGLSSARVQMFSDEELTMKNSTGWDRDKYLNVWVIREICPATGCQPGDVVLGFAPLPGGERAREGVVVISDFFGRASGGQTMTHEVGHYLNLYHPFQGGCTGMRDNNCATGGDRVCDTPPTAAANYDNARRQNSCAENISILGGDKPDLLRSYMEYLNDASLDLFSEGQAVRMQATLRNPSVLDRKQWQFLQQTGTGPWGRVKANFALKGCEQPPCVVCPNQPLVLTSYSMGKPHLFQWEIRRGSQVVVASSEGPCATIVAPSIPDTYSVFLRVENYAASAETTYTDFLIVRDLNEVSSYPFIEDFEGTFPPRGWVIVNPDFATRNSQNITWERYRSTGGGSYGGSNAALRVRNHRYYNYSQRDHLITPLIRIPESSIDPTLAFDIYYRAVRWSDASNQPLLYQDTLSVYISQDCGSTWRLLYEENGESLDIEGVPIQALNSSYPAELVPPQGPNGKWRRKKVRIPDEYKGSTVLIRFENRTGMGNTLYLDSVHINDAQLIPATLSTESAVIRFIPNPVQGDIGWLSIQGVQASVLSYELLEPTGRLLRSGSLEVGTEAIPIPLHGIPSGVYLLVVRQPSASPLFHRIVVVD
ncbi:MAG: M43 family zinc metalloprotease [Bacteroidia bacterium]|nr:M43 family zinc metalloprotease [Bacteroidia bacterium]MDW8015176.1 M43 family zinc metalloprotease [Bacteroidia bacterium]